MVTIMVNGKQIVLENEGFGYKGKQVHFSEGPLLAGEPGSSGG